MMPVTEAIVSPWYAVEEAARVQVAAELRAMELRSLVFGDRIAWAEQLFGRTHDLSELHRVGHLIDNKPHTTCHMLIPAPKLRLVLCPALLRSLKVCRYCEGEHARLTRNAA